MARSDSNIRKSETTTNRPEMAKDRADSPSRRLVPPPKSTEVRMYRQGLGDCFLVAFATQDPNAPYYLLIDCGVILGTQDASTTMDRVVRDVHDATGGTLHLLVVTHEHWDHVSGFLQASAAFKSLQIEQVWFAWTEDPKDALAQKLRQNFDKELGLLRNAVARAVDSRSVEHIANLLGFFGLSPNFAHAASASDTRAAMQAAAKLGQTTPQYHLPGTGPLPLPGSQGESLANAVRIYILGPPHDEKELRRINPTKSGKEVYTERSALTQRTAFLSALQDPAQSSEAEQDVQRLSFPFDSMLQVPTSEAKTIPFFRDNYGFEHRAKPLVKKQTAQGQPPGHRSAWRRIDDDWLGLAGDLALKLDSYTNNTSLVLAIELVSTGKVLLFAADAQVGNWLSWDQYRWQTTDSNGHKQEIRIGDLLNRTVLYKVGHHGSHNATVRGLGTELKGLELMNHPELVAMIPVDHAMAVVKGWDKMPFEPLLRRLEEKTGHRLMRVDDPHPKPKPDAMSDAAWGSFRKSFAETDLYLQFRILDQ